MGEYLYFCPNVRAIITDKSIALATMALVKERVSSASALIINISRNVNHEYSTGVCNLRRDITIYLSPNMTAV